MLAYLGWLGKGAIKWVSLCVYILSVYTYLPSGFNGF